MNTTKTGSDDNSESIVADSQQLSTDTTDQAAGILVDAGASLDQTVETNTSTLEHPEELDDKLNLDQTEDNINLNTSDNLYTFDNHTTPFINKMATTIPLPKFDGTESPCIWLSKLSAWQKFNRLSDRAVLDYVPCLLDGSAGTWFQTLIPTLYPTLQDFMGLFTERFKPASHRVTMLQIKQEPGETCEKYLERAERLALAHHDLDEAYKVQFIANGLFTLLPLFTLFTD